LAGLEKPRIDTTKRLPRRLHDDFGWPVFFSFLFYDMNKGIPDSSVFTFLPGKVMYIVSLLLVIPSGFWEAWCEWR